MKYVIVSNGSAVSTIGQWTPGLAKKCWLQGVSKPPSVPLQLRNGSTLHEVDTVREGVGLDYQQMQDFPGSLVGDKWTIPRRPVDVFEGNAKSQALAKIKVNRNAALTGSFNWGEYIVQGRKDDIDNMKDVRDIQKEAISRGAPENAVLRAWRTEDNGKTTPLSPAEINDMVYTKGQQGMAAWNRFYDLEEEILAAVDLDALRLIDLDTGFPTVTYPPEPEVIPEPEPEPEVAPEPAP